MFGLAVMSLTKGLTVVSCGERAIPDRIFDGKDLDHRRRLVNWVGCLFLGVHHWECPSVGVVCICQVWDTVGFVSLFFFFFG